MGLQSGDRTILPGLINPGPQSQQCCVFTSIRNCAADDSGVAALVGVLQEVDDADVQLDMLKGIQAGLRGRRHVAMPSGWNDVYQSQLSRSKNEEVCRRAQAFANRNTRGLVFVAQTTASCYSKVPEGDGRLTRRPTKPFPRRQPNCDSTCQPAYPSLTRRVPLKKAQPKSWAFSSVPRRMNPTTAYSASTVSSYTNCAGGVLASAKPAGLTAATKCRLAAGISYRRIVSSRSSGSSRLIAFQRRSVRNKGSVVFIRPGRTSGAGECRGDAERQHPPFPRFW